MQQYTREVAERIIKCRQDPEGRHENDDFIVKDDGVFPVKGIASLEQEFQDGVWRPACELSVQAKPSWLQPSLPIPFNGNELAAFFLHGNGWYVRDSFGAWEDGPNDAVFEQMLQPDDDIASLVVPLVKRAVADAFAAYHAAERVIGSFDSTLAVDVQKSEDTLRRAGTSTCSAEQREALRRARERANGAESEWRKNMVNQLLPASASAPKSEVEPASSVALPKQRAQETSILTLLKEQGHKPSNLPNRAQGKRGVKAAIKSAALQLKPVMFSSNSFDKAWQRLRNDGEITGG